MFVSIDNLVKILTDCVKTCLKPSIRIFENSYLIKERSTMDYIILEIGTRIVILISNYRERCLRFDCKAFM